MGEYREKQSSEWNFNVIPYPSRSQPSPHWVNIGKWRRSCSRTRVQVSPTAPLGGSGRPACERSSPLWFFFVIRAQKSLLSFSFGSFPNMLDHDNFGNWACHPVWGQCVRLKDPLSLTWKPGFPRPLQAGSLLKTAFVCCHTAITCLIVEIQFEKKTRRRKKRNCHLQLQSLKPSEAQDTSEFVKYLDASFVFVAGLLHLRLTSQILSIQWGLCFLLSKTHHRI